jgi:hypothetical protein
MSQLKVKRQKREGKSEMWGGGLYLRFLRLLTFNLILVAFDFPFVFAQGMMPKSKTDTTPPPEAPYLMMGQTLQPTVTVRDGQNTVRPLISYKNITNLLVVAFLTTRCETNKKFWNELKRFYEDYGGWHASFVAVSASREETREELEQALKHWKLPFTAVRDEAQKASRELNVTSLPVILVFDEWGQLRYRGNVKEARTALEAIVAQDPKKIITETQPEGCALQ